MKARKKSTRKDATVRASVSFSANLYSELERIAAGQRVSVAWVVRDAAEEYIKSKWPLLQEPSTEKDQS
jgi:metal-responsive CopG/Arc/MetJ family transcriptional regulator